MTTDSSAAPTAAVAPGPGSTPVTPPTALEDEEEEEEVEEEECVSALQLVGGQCGLLFWNTFGKCDWLIDRSIDFLPDYGCDEEEVF